MKTLQILVILSTALLQACIATSSPLPPRFKPYTSPDQTRRDELYCKQVAYQELTARGMNGNLFKNVILNQEINECMSFLGYQ